MAPIDPLDTHRCIVLLPALNEERAVKGTIVDYAKHFPDAFILIVNNGSEDETVANAKDALNLVKNDSMVLSEPRRGKVNAVRKALASFDALIWVIADCDATYPAEEMRKIYLAMVAERFDHGVADRISQKAYKNKNKVRTAFNLTGNKLFSWFAALITGKKQRDVFSGGRVFSSPLIRSIYFETEGFELEMELTLQSDALDADIRYFPINYHQRLEGSETKLRPLRDGFRILNFVFRYVVLYRTTLLLNLVALMFTASGLSFGFHLIFVYLELGTVPYSATAALVSIFLIIATILFVASILVRANRATAELFRKIEFQNKKVRWNKSLGANYSGT